MGNKYATCFKDPCVEHLEKISLQRMPYVCSSMAKTQALCSKIISVLSKRQIWLTIKSHHKNREKIFHNKTIYISCLAFLCFIHLQIFFSTFFFHFIQQDFRFLVIGQYQTVFDFSTKRRSSLLFNPSNSYMELNKTETHRNTRSILNAS